jgi:hypothetical protein
VIDKPATVDGMFFVVKWQQLHHVKLNDCEAYIGRRKPYCVLFLEGADCDLSTWTKKDITIRLIIIKAIILSSAKLKQSGFYRLVKKQRGALSNEITQENVVFFIGIPHGNVDDGCF